MFYSPSLYKIPNPSNSSSADQMRSQRSQGCLPRNGEWRPSSRRRRGRGTLDKPHLTRTLLKKRKGSSGKRLSEDQTFCTQEIVCNVNLFHQQGAFTALEHAIIERCFICMYMLQFEAVVCFFKTVST